MKAGLVVQKIQIKRATIEDAEAIASVLHESFAEFESFYTPAAFAVTTSTTNQLRDRWNEGPVWIAMQNGEIVGTVAAVPKSSGLYIRSMAVCPAARGQGIALQLLKEIERFAINQHHARLFLSTTPLLKGAIHLYERFGFRRNNAGPQNLFGTLLFTMVKQVEPAEG